MAMAEREGYNMTTITEVIRGKDRLTLYSDEESSEAVLF